MANTTLVIQAAEESLDALADEYEESVVERDDSMGAIAIETDDHAEVVSYMDAEEIESDHVELRVDTEPIEIPLSDLLGP